MAVVPDQSEVAMMNIDEYQDSAGISQFLQLECKVQPEGQVKLDGGATSNMCEQCLICGKFFPFKSTLRYHLRKSHHIVTDGLDDINYFQQKKCDLCQAQFTLKEELVQHLKVAHTNKNNQNFKCDICHENFIHKYRLRDHVVKIHFPEITCQYERGDIKSITCLSCTPKTDFQSEESFINHFNENHTTNKCHNCGMDFVNNNLLLKHIPQCFKLFGCIKIHKYNDTSDKFNCHSCPFCKVKKKNLAQHMNTCKYRPHKSPDYMDIKYSNECPICTTVINLQAENINKHILECNLELGSNKGYKIVALSQIHKECYSVSPKDISSNKSIPSKTEHKQKIIKEAESSKISKHMCVICDQNIEMTQLEFLNHLQHCIAIKNLEDVINKCKLCGKYYINKDKNSLEKHIKSCQFSKKLKSFLCTTCNFVFASKVDFKEHLKFCSKILPTKSGSVVVGIHHQSVDTHAAKFCESMRLIHKIKFAKNTTETAGSSTITSPLNQFDCVFIKSEINDENE